MIRPGVFDFIQQQIQEHNNIEEEDDLSNDDSGSSEETELSDEQESDSGDEQSVVEDDVVQHPPYNFRNGAFQWNPHAPNQRGRRNCQNIIHEREGPAPHVRPEEVVDIAYRIF